MKLCCEALNCTCPRRPLYEWACVCVYACMCVKALLCLYILNYSILLTPAGNRVAVRCVLYSMYSAMYEKKTFNLKRDVNDCGWPPDAAPPPILCYKDKKPQRLMPVDSESSNPSDPSRFPSLSAMAAHRKCRITWLQLRPTAAGSPAP